MIFYVCRHCRQGYLHAAQPETFLMLCVFAAWFLLIGSDPSPGLVPGPPPSQGRGQGWTLRVARYFAVGLILGVAFWLKYNAVAFFPFVTLLPFVDFRGLDQGFARLRPTGDVGAGREPPLLDPVQSSAGVCMLIPWKDWLGRMLIVAAGFVFTVAAVLAYFRVSGAWPAMKEIQFEVLPRYGAMAFHWSFYYLYWALWQTQNHMGIWWEVMPALSLLIAWRCRELGRIAPIGLLALAGYISTAMQGRFHPYYFETCYPFFAMFWAYVGVKTYEGFTQLQRIFLQQHWALARVMLWVVFRQPHLFAAAGRKCARCRAV